MPRRRGPRWLKMFGMTGARREISKWRLQACIVFVVGALIIYPLTGTREDNVYQTDSRHGGGRRLLSTVNQTHTSPFESCAYEKSTLPIVWIISHSVCVLIIFVALALICDDFFVPSLEVISEKLHLSEDVAGATFMAAGSSAPELFTAVAGVAVKTDVGVGTIVGSAVFNLLIIIALTSVLAGQLLVLDWRPLLRDSFFYGVSIACFIGFSWDGYFEHYEACLLLALYTIYIILMVFNYRLLEWMSHLICCSTTSVIPTDEEADGKDGGGGGGKETHHAPSSVDSVRRVSLSGGHVRRLTLISQKSQHDVTDTEHIFHHRRGSVALALHLGNGHHHRQPEVGETVPNSFDKKDTPVDAEEAGGECGIVDADQDRVQLFPCWPCCPLIRGAPPDCTNARDEGGCWLWCKVILRWILFIPSFPFLVMFSLTIPDCSETNNKKWYIVSFVVSVMWIAILSFGMVTLVGRAGCILNVNTYVMGLVVIAIGTSIPDALSSILVARDGYGDMAVSNAIGSNVFDINLGIGLPFIIRIVIDKGEAISLLNAKQWTDFHSGKMAIVPHVKFGLILLLILVIAFSVFAVARFRLHKFIGVIFVFLYVLFLAYAFTQEIYCIRSLDVYC